MSFDTLTNANPFGLKNGDKLTFAYPTGRTADSYVPTGAVLTLPGVGSIKQSDDIFFVVYGPSSITVHYGAGPRIASGAVTLKAPVAGEADVATGISIVTLTSAAYTALATKDASTLYVIVG